MIHLRDARFLVLDIETTGLDPATEKVLEVAWVTFHHGAIRGYGGTLVNPGAPIPAAATRIHGISDDMVQDAPSLAGALVPMEQLLPHINAVVCHNVAFDLAFLPDLGKPTLCTLAWSRLAWPQRSHRLQSLAKEMGLREHLPDLYRAAHRALPDAMLTAMLLARLIDQAPEGLTLEGLLAEGWAC